MCVRWRSGWALLADVDAAESSVGALRGTPRGQRRLLRVLPAWSLTPRPMDVVASARAMNRWVVAMRLE